MPSFNNAGQRAKYFQQPPSTNRYNTPSNKPEPWERARIDRRTFNSVVALTAAQQLFLRIKELKSSNKEATPEVIKAKTLPIAEYREVICRSIENSQVTIVMAETGAGKTTQVPQYLAELGKKVHVIQPRRFATVSVAGHVKSQYVGGPEKVGFKHALAKNAAPDCDITFYTDGYFLQMLKNISNFGPDDVIVLDEVHEHSEAMMAIHALLRERMIQGTAPKIVLMSATMNANILTNYYKNCESAIPIINVPGRTFGQTELIPAKTIEDSIAREVKLGRDVLVFLPGKAAIAEVSEQLAAMKINAEIMPLHSKLPGEEQDRVHRKYDRPRVILSTNIAQTSVTIDGIDTVIVSGKIRRKRLEGGVETLSFEDISQSEYIQQIGRAGRTRPGFFINHGLPFEMLTKEEYLPILNSNLESLYLRLYAGGFNPRSLQFLAQPKSYVEKKCIKTLQRLGAIDRKENITKRGEVMAGLPVDPRIGKLIALTNFIYPNNIKLRAAVIDVAAIIQAQGIVSLLHHKGSGDNAIDSISGKFRTSDIIGQLAYFDMVSRLDPLDLELKNKLDKKFELNPLGYGRFMEIRTELRRRLGINRNLQYEKLTEPNFEKLLSLVIKSWSDMVFYSNGNDAKGRTLYSHISRELKNSRVIGKESAVKAEHWVVGTPLNIQFLKDDGETIETTYVLHSVTNVDRELLDKYLGTEFKQDILLAEKHLVEQEDSQSEGRKRRKGHGRVNSRNIGRGTRLN